MSIRSVALIIAIGAMALCICSCDAITGGGDAPPPPAVPGIAPPAPGMPTAPGAPPALPGQPGAAPALPGVPGQPTAPAAPPAPGMPTPPPTPAVPGQPAPTPVAPGAPAPAPAPGQPAAPAAPAMPGQPSALPAPGAPAAQPAAPPPTGDALVDKLNATKAAQAGDKTGTSSMLRQPLEKGKTQSYHVQLPGPPFCHAYIAVGDDKVTNLDISIESTLNPGTVEAQDSTQDAVAVIPNHCPTASGQYKLNVEMAGGSGEFAVQVFSASAAAAQ